MVEQAALSGALIQSAKEVFETMVFMSLEECTEDDLTIDNNPMLGSIAFKGSMEGSLGICCGFSCAQAVTKNMLGVGNNRKISEEEARDAIGEVANMVMGCFKLQLMDTVGNLEVWTPSIVNGRELINNMNENTNKILIKVNIADKYISELSLLYRVN